MMNHSDVTISTFSHTGEQMLAVDHYPGSKGSNVPHIMFCGGFHSSMQGTKACAIKALCLENNWHYTRFDYRGHGQSSGEAAAFTLTDWLDDTLAVLDQQQLPTLLIGSSMGAWLATLASLRRPDSVTALLLLAAAPDFLSELVAPELSVADKWDLQQGKVVNLASHYDDRPYPISQALLDSAMSLSLLDNDALLALHCPARLIHGTADADVPYELSTRLMSKMPPGHDARLALLHGADHRLSDTGSLSYIEKEIHTLINHLHEQISSP